MEKEGAQPPRVAKQKEFTPYRAWSAAPEGLRGLLGQGQDSPTAGHSRTYQAFSILGEISQIWGKKQSSKKATEKNQTDS